MNKRDLLRVALAIVILVALAAVPASAVAATWPTYVVKPGDTLSRIAVSHSVSLASLIAANGASAPYTIYPGQILYIPDANAPIWIDSPANWQTVSSAIAVTGHSTTFEAGLSVRVRDRWGTVLAETSTMGGGMGVFAPFAATLTYSVAYGQWGSEEAYDLSAATGAEVYNTGVRVYLSPGGADAGRYHTVVAGETLTRIALRNGTTWRTLASLNGLANPNLVYVGQRLRLP